MEDNEKVETSKASPPAGKVWPGNRLPVPNPLILDQRMDATWGRGKFRSEVWDDDPNPLNDWWEVYSPSDEVVEAIALGFDFKDPKGWCEKYGIDFDKALAELSKLKQEKLAEFQKANPKADKNADVSAILAEYYEIQNKLFEVSFRIYDDLKQKEKGQPSLDEEDTGLQWKNDLNMQISLHASIFLRVKQFLLFVSHFQELLSFDPFLVISSQLLELLLLLSFLIFP